MTVPPRSVASREARPPPIFPNGVRAAPRITVLGICGSPLRGSKTISPGYVARRRLSMRRALVAVPGSRIRIEGHYPFARYFSWNVYDAAGRPIDAMNDAQPPARPGIAGDVHRLDRVRAEAAESRAQHALHGRLPR